MTSSARRVVRTRMFCDGHYSVISSSSLGGSAIDSEEMADVLGHEPPKLTEWIAGGVCMPVAFPGDCALDDLIVVVGDLPEQAEREWVGRIAGRLNVPCGKLLIVCGGGDPYDWDNALGREDDDPDEDLFSSVEIPPGEYLAELFCYANSMSAAFGILEKEGQILEWFAQSHPGQEVPRFVEYVGKGNNWELGGYVDYLLRLRPFDAQSAELTPVTGWFRDFVWRRPESCPLGLPAALLLPEEGENADDEDDDD